MNATSGTTREKDNSVSRLSAQSYRLSFRRLVSRTLPVLAAALLFAQAAAVQGQAPAPAPQPAPAPAPVAAPQPVPAPAAAPTPPPPAPLPQAPADYPQQIRIKARILEWTHDSSIDWGFNINYLSKDSDSLTWARLLLPSQHLKDTNQGVQAILKGGENPDILAVIQMLEQLGDVRVISQPNIVAKCPPFGAPEATVADGKYSAKVSTDSDIPYETAKTAGYTLAQVTEYIKISTQLSVTVAGMKDKFIKLHINASVNDLGSYVSVGTDTKGNPLQVPRTEERSITNTVLVADRQVFIAGLLKTAKNNKKSQGIPWLAELPIVGYLFKNQERTGKDQELLFIIQPEIVRT
jgi:type II secretory pathway component GspD/PulD (secretin)